MVEQLLYSSIATPAMTRDGLAQIERTSLIYNPLQTITGLLAFDGKRFMQLIEGPAAAIDALYLRLERDPRHSQLETLYRGTADARAFSDWAMRCVRLPDTADAIKRMESLLPARLDPALRSLMIGFVADPAAS